MIEADYIDKADIVDDELEFGNLRELGIAEIQRLAADNWTDFNTHDPGVTILEQLVFAVTELGYKTNFDIKDLLASQQNNARVNDTFFSAANILLGKPITTTDFRKVLIDRVDGLRDVWIEPLNLSRGKHDIKGMYIVFINFSPDIIQTEKDKEKLIIDTRTCLEKYSNLGEAFDDIVVLEQEEIYVSAEIELESEANVDRTHAQVLYQLKRFISSPHSFHSVSEMLALGYTYEEIFEGPKLHHGFIRNEDLKDKITTLLNSHLINVVLEVEGVSKVRKLKVQKGDSPAGKERKSLSAVEMHDGVVIDMNKVAVLAKKMLPNDSTYTEFISYRQNQEIAEPFKDNVIRYLHQIENENKVDYNLLHDRVNDILPEKGEPKPLENYYSVQQHFPAIYALGQDGIPPSFDEERKSKVKQLKAFLLTFEQMMTNYLAQLSNFSALFSLDEDLSQSYFSGSLASVPHLKELMFRLENANTNDEIEQISRKISRKAQRDIDNFYERRHQALDHLLARFGEQVSNFGIAKFNYYYNRKDHLNRMMASKIKLLKEITFLSARRARSFNSQKKYWPHTDDENKNHHQNISYLELKTKIRLGIQLTNKKLSEYLQQQIGEWKQAKILTPGRLSRQLTRDSRDDGRLVLHTVGNPKQPASDFKAGIEIDNALLRRGIWPNTFKIITDKKDKQINWLAFSEKLFFNAMDINMQKDIEEKLLAATRDLVTKPKYVRFLDNTENKQALLIEFQKSEGDNYHAVPVNVWRILKSFQTRGEAQEYASGLINYLRQLNINSEGFHLVDHIELRPRSQTNSYGIELKDAQSNTAFVSARKYKYVDIQNALIELIHKAKNARYVHEGGHKTRLVFQGETIGHCKALDPGQATDSSRCEAQLKQLFDSLTDFDLHNPSVIRFYCKDEIDTDIGGGLFYSFRASVIVPDWPARFADPAFKKVLEKTIREDAPAHISFDFYYLNFNKMKEFESLYSHWLDDMRKLLHTRPEEVNNSSNKLALFIKNLETKI